MAVGPPSHQAPHHPALCGTADQCQSEGLRQRPDLSGQRQISVRTGPELLLLPCRLRFLSSGRSPKRAGRHEYQTSLLCVRHTDALWSALRSLDVRFPVSLRTDPGPSAQDPLPQGKKEPLHPDRFLLQVLVAGIHGDHPAAPVFLPGFPGSSAPLARFTGCSTRSPSLG